MRDDLVIAWDFDGVLNRNIRDGRFIWADRFQQDLGQSRAVFESHIFGRDLDRIITGAEDLRDRVSDWADAVGFAGGPDVVLDYWFSQDDLPDQELLALVRSLHRQGIRQVIATNNEPRRASYIETQTVFAPYMDGVFASGRMGKRKPWPGYFRIMTEAIGVEPAAMILVDDSQANVEQARNLGWVANYFNDDTRGAIITQIKAMLSE